MRNLNEISEKINSLNDRIEAEKREATAEELMQLKSLEREYNAAKREAEIETIKMQREAAEPVKTNGQKLREFIKNAKQGETYVVQRDYTVGITKTGTAANGGIQNASGIGLTINNVIPAEGYGLIWDKVGAPIQTNVHGNVQWPIAGFVEATLQGELESATDQAIKLDAVTAVQKRLSIRIKVSNAAINDVNYDLEGFVAQQARIGIYNKLNHALCCSAKVANDFYGPFAHADVQTTTWTKGGKFSYAKAMEMVGMVADKGFNGEHIGFCMSPSMFYALKATPVDAGSGLMVIDAEGKLAGFPVAVSRDMTQPATRGGSKAAEVVGCGDFAYLPINQHGDMRVSIDNSSSEAAKEDVTIITINSYWSLTNLKPEAFVKATESLN